MLFSMRYLQLTDWDDRKKNKVNRESSRWFLQWTSCLTLNLLIKYGKEVNDYFRFQLNLLLKFQFSIFSFEAFIDSFHHRYFHVSKSSFMNIHQLHFVVFHFLRNYTNYLRTYNFLLCHLFLWFYRSRMAKYWYFKYW